MEGSTRFNQKEVNVHLTSHVCLMVKASGQCYNIVLMHTQTSFVVGLSTKGDLVHRDFTQISGKSNFQATSMEIVKSATFVYVIYTLGQLRKILRRPLSLKPTLVKLEYSVP